MSAQVASRVCVPSCQSDEQGSLRNAAATIKIAARPSFRDGQYGIYFDTGKADLELSQWRADAVVQALAGKHGVAAARLHAGGIGPLAPVASNDAEEGRALNRRVELVKQ